MEDDKFKKLIQRIDPGGPSAAFTDNIMKVIESQEEFSLDPALLSVLKKELLAGPAFEFSNKLMAAIQPKTPVVLKPIIPKKAWLIISAIVFSILLWVLINPPPTVNHKQHHSYFSRFSLNVSGAISGIINTSTAILPYLIPLSILLLIDYVLRTRQRQLT